MGAQNTKYLEAFLLGLEDADFVNGLEIVCEGVVTEDDKLHGL